LVLAATSRIPVTRVDEVLDRVGLSEVAGQRAGKFSLGMGQRLGIAAALLGDPGVLLFDEPINGLDPDGIRWVRNLLRALAREGRTVFVSSHLMSEMALTADHLVVIGRGRLIAEMPVDEFIAQSSQQFVRVRTPHPNEFVETMRSSGATVVWEEDGALSVAGLNAQEIGDIAYEQRLALHELSPQLASLEEAFMELTHDSVDYRSSASTTNDQADDPK
jgi:ABC-2 type transport system ATP-binding protein